MIGHRQLNFDDYTEILRRRWWIVLIPTLVLGVGAYAGSLFLPDQFTSRTLVLVEQQKVPNEYVKSVETGDISQRLGTMQEQILSRTRLQPIIDKFGLFKKDKGKVAMEDLVDRLRKSIEIFPIQSLVTTRNGELPGFTISFTGNDPRLAQQVCAEITSMFIEENLRLRELRAEGTTDFLKTQLELAKRNLDEQDAKLAGFKQRYIGSLPGNEQTDMSLMTGLSSQLDAVTSQLNRAQQDKAYMESLLAQQVATWQASQTGGGTPHGELLEKQLADLRDLLASLEAHYTESHPDVIKVKERIAALEQKIKDNAAPANGTVQAQDTTERPEPPEIQKIRFQIHQLEVLTREKTREQSRLRGQVGIFQARLSMSPVVEQQFKELTRDHETALEFYNTLLAKKSESEMATSLERRQQGEQFRVMDPPDLPEKPSFPNRPAIAGGGLGFGFALGIGIILLLEFRDRTLRTESDVEQMLRLPTLAMVPLINDRKNFGKNGGRPGAGKGSRLSVTAHR